MGSARGNYAFQVSGGRLWGRCGIGAARDPGVCNERLQFANSALTDAWLPPAANSSGILAPRAHAATMCRPVFAGRRRPAAEKSHSGSWEWERIEIWVSRSICLMP